MAGDEYACPKCYAVAKKADSLSAFMTGELGEMSSKGYYSGEEIKGNLEGLLIGGASKGGPSRTVSCWKCGHEIDIKGIFAGKYDARACFIATAIYESSAAPELEPLRRFREHRLRPNAVGRALIAVYERLGPPLARVVARRPVMRKRLRPFFDFLSAALGRSMLGKAWAPRARGRSTA